MKDSSESVQKKDVPELSKFVWQDPLLMEDDLSDSERLLIKSVREFSEKELQPKVAKAFQSEQIDRGVIKAMGDMGLLGVTITEEYGGLDANYVSYGLIAREIERIDSGYRSMMSVQSSLVMYPIFAFGSKEQKEKFLPGLAKGDLVGCFGLTEANAGSDPGGMTTRAKKVPEGYKLTGEKCWISNSPIADIFIIPSIMVNGHTEGLGVVTIEAMACGTAVVGSDIGGIPDVINDGHNGFLVPQKSSDMIAKRIIKILSNAKIKNEFINNGLKTVQEKFSWNVVSKKFCRLF